MPLAQLISAIALHARLQEPNLVLLDCRFALEDPGYGARSHAEGHLPGAHFGKQFLLFGFAVRRVDKSDFFFRDSGVHQFLF